MGNYKIKYNEKSSWTKYDIVQTMDLIFSEETIRNYLKKNAPIDTPILCSFLGIKTINSELPDYWVKIQKYHPNEKKIFALLTAIFMHHNVVSLFALKYSTNDMCGVYYINSENGSNKMQTNIRSLLVLSEVTPPTNRRKKKDVHYDLSRIFYNSDIGKLFKEVLLERMSRTCNIDGITDEDFYEFCLFNNFHKAISLTEEQFQLWLEGKTFEANYIKKVTINKFISISEPIKIDLEESKEVYFLGENGDGKSLILMAMYLAFNGNYILNNTEQDDTGKASDFLKDSDLTGKDICNHDFNINNAIYLKNIYAYGTHRGRYSSEPSEKHGFMSLFGSEYTLKNPEQWLKDIVLDEGKATESSNDIKLATNALKDIIESILGKRIVVDINGKDVRFIENECNQLTLDQLSEGYRSIIIFVCDLLYRLYENNESNILTTKGAVLVDEIDLHLHIKLQREIVQRLRNTFPNIQFVFTTHSPFIIQGASDDALLFRTYRENGQTKVSEPFYRRDLNKLMMNTLVTSSIFGMGDSRMNTDEDNANTSESYTQYKLMQRIDVSLKKQKENGRTFISDEEIDRLVDEILNEEIQNDKDI